MKGTQCQVSSATWTGCGLEEVLDYHTAILVELVVPEPHVLSDCSVRVSHRHRSVVVCAG